MVLVSDKDTGSSGVQCGGGRELGLASVNGLRGRRETCSNRRSGRRSEELCAFPLLWIPGEGRGWRGIEDKGLRLKSDGRDLGVRL